MKQFVFTAMCYAGFGYAQAQDSTTVIANFKDTVAIKPDTSYWQRSFSGGINFNQASFSNWTGGGVNSVALGAVVAARALYEKARWSWDNTADLQLGFVTQGSTTRKAADQIFLNTVAGYQIAPKFDLFFRERSPLSSRRVISMPTWARVKTGSKCRIFWLPVS